MNTFKGPFRIIFEDLRLQFLIIGSITLFIYIFMVGLGYVLAVDEFSAAIFGPAYGLLAIYPFLLFTKVFRYNLAFGGTRKQFIASLYTNILLYTVVFMVVLNGVYQFNEWLIAQDIHSFTLIHTGMMLESHHMLLYFWVDFIFGLFAFALGLIINAIWHYIGTVKALFLGALVSIAMIVWYTFGDVMHVLQWIIENRLSFIHVLLLIALLFLGVSYLLIKNGPIERGGHQGKAEE